MTVAISTLPESAPEVTLLSKAFPTIMKKSNLFFSKLDNFYQTRTYFNEEGHHVEKLVDADGPVAVLVEEVEDAEQVVLGLTVAEEVEQHAHAVES